MFVEILNQLAEIENFEKLDTQELDNENRAKTNMESADQEEYLDAVMENRNSIKVTYKNVKKVDINIFKTDMEVLFSKNPFMNDNRKTFNYVAPYLCKTQACDTYPLQTSEYNTWR